MPPKQSTESEKTSVWEFTIRTALSHKRDDSLHIRWSQLIVDTPVVSVCSLINLSVVGNHCSTDFEDWFLTDREFIERHEYTNRRVRIEVFQLVRRFHIEMFLTIKKTFSTLPKSTFRFWISWIFWNFEFSWTSLVFSRHRCHRFVSLCWRVLPADSESSDPCPLAQVCFPVMKNCWASLCHPSKLDAASGLEFWFMISSSLPDNPTCRLETLSIPELLDEIGLFTGEELAATELVRSIAVGLVFATILFSSHCSCILFAILSVQLIKLKFLAQQRDWNGWCWTNKEGYSIRHVWSVLWSKCLRSGVWSHFTEFESWGPNWFCQTTNQEKLCGFLTHVSLLDSCFWLSSWSRLHCPQTRTT